jgi:hypothetical protein
MADSVLRSYMGNEGALLGTGLQEQEQRDEGDIFSEVSY